MPYKKHTVDKKQLNTNNFIKNTTYCKIYFSFIVGNILNFDTILTPPVPPVPPPPQSGCQCWELSLSLIFPLLSRVVMDQVFVQDLPALPGLAQHVRPQSWSPSEGWS